MGIIYEGTDKIEYSIESNKCKVTFTALDMQNFIGHEVREPYRNQNSTPYWETMFVEITSEDPSKCLSGEFLIDSSGTFQRLIISDNEGNKRVILQEKLNKMIPEEEYENYFGKGTHKQGNELLKELYVEKTPGNEIGKTYYYDESTGKFIDEDGIEAPDSILTEKEIGNIIRESANKISKGLRDREKSKDGVDLVIDNNIDNHESGR